MRVAFSCLAAVLLILAACTGPATAWDYFYDGSYDPVNDGWTQGGATEQAVWGQDDGSGVSALKISHDAVTWVGNEPRYTKTGIPAHHALIYQMRFRIEGGAPTAIPSGQNVYYQRVQYNDSRSRLERCNNAPQEGATGDDFYDPDMVSDPLLRAFDGNWHTYTLIGVGAAAPGATDVGTGVYFDGQLVGSRPGGLSGNAYSVIVGIVGKPTTAWGQGSLWVDDIAWAFNDTPDEFGKYGIWVVPEPSALAVLGASVAGFACAFRRRIRL